jgi:hypothetical protein
MNNEKIKKEYRKTILFTTVSKKVKHVGINLTKHVNDLYNENYKPLRQKSKKKMERSHILMGWQNQHSKKWQYYQKQSTCSMKFSSKSQ